MLRTIIEFIVYSSKNSQKISLTVKGALVSVVAILVYFFPGTDFSSAIDTIVLLVQQILAALGTAMLVVGVIRKLWTTVRGTNDQINNP